jgi:hypothetical protein
MQLAAAETPLSGGVSAAAPRAGRFVPGIAPGFGGALSVKRRQKTRIVENPGGIR